MRRGVVLVAVACTLMGACSDDKAPANHTSSSAVSSGSDQAQARAMARTLADGLQQGAAGRITSAQADCLANEITARVRTTVLTGIASSEPDPKTLPKDVRTAFGEAFDKCLSSDVAKQLRQQFGV